MFAFKDGKTLLSYCPNKKKVVLLLSTMHQTDEMTQSLTWLKNPTFCLLQLYKRGVDVADECKARYAVAKTSNRWPLTLFFSLLNTIGLNSFIMFKHKTGNFGSVRKEFLKELARDLCHNYLVIRHSEERLPRQLKTNIQQMLGLEDEPKQVPVENAESRCGACGWRKIRKSKTTCRTCHSFICREHTVFTCVQCAEENPAYSTDDED